MNLVDTIPLDRQSPRSALEAFKKAKDLIVDYRRSVVLFPEGTRGHEGNKVQTFLPAAMKLPQMANAPIIPVSFIDTYKVLDKNERKAHGGKKLVVKVIFGKPIMPSKHLQLRTDLLAALVQKEVQRGIDENINQELTPLEELFNTKKAEKRAAKAEKQVAKAKRQKQKAAMKAAKKQAQADVQSKTKKNTKKKKPAAVSVKGNKQTLAEEMNQVVVSKAGSKKKKHLISKKKAIVSHPTKVSDQGQTTKKTVNDQKAVALQTKDKSKTKTDKEKVSKKTITAKPKAKKVVSSTSKPKATGKKTAVKSKTTSHNQKAKVVGESKAKPKKTTSTTIAKKVAAKKKLAPMKITKKQVKKTATVRRASVGKKKPEVL
jgi:hypothetical protein